MTPATTSSSRPVSLVPDTRAVTTATAARHRHTEDQGTSNEAADLEAAEAAHAPPDDDESGDGSQAVGDREREGKPASSDDVMSVGLPE